jgi:hypothetical protein
MKRFLLSVIIFFSTTGIIAQKNKYMSLGVYNTQTAMPFGKFAGLFGEILHPGVEIGYGKIISPKQKHEWFSEWKFSYFFHRFVQHGIPITYNYGYRYKFNSKFSAETSLGGGYMHSIPATAKLKLNSDGEYENNKGIGRMQATANFSIGISYISNPKAQRPVRLFTLYQQRLQMPFVRSYVPLLPYNSFMIGVSRSIKNKLTSK